MQISFRPMQHEDCVGVIEIFNYYIDYSFAVYPEQPISYDFFNWFLEVDRGYPTVTASSENEATEGFCLLDPFTIPA